MVNEVQLDTCAYIHRCLYVQVEGILDQVEDILDTWDNGSDMEDNADTKALLKDNHILHNHTAAAEGIHTDDLFHRCHKLTLLVVLETS